jgi:hypothetical protein
VAFEDIVSERIAIGDYSKPTLLNFAVFSGKGIRIKLSRKEAHGTTQRKPVA